MCRELQTQETPGAKFCLPGPPKWPKMMNPMLPILSILGYWAIILGTFGGPGR